MKWSRSELIQSGNFNVTVDEDTVLPEDAFDGFSLIDGAKDVHVSGTGFLDTDEDRFYADLHITGSMLVMDAISGRQIAVPFETDASETYAFEPVEDEDEDIRVVTDDVIDLMPAVRDAILMEVPLQVTDVDPQDYPSGDGWRVITEEEYESSKKNAIDPRLAKLQEFKEGKE